MIYEIKGKDTWLKLQKLNIVQLSTQSSPKSHYECWIHLKMNFYIVHCDSGQ